MKKISKEEIKEIQIYMLKYLDNVCKENNIDYFLMSGSLIGAIRHQGFIPWDDDIDVGLTRDNYQKLLDVIKTKNHDYIYLMNHDTQEDYFYPFAKLVDMRTEVIDKRFKDIKNYGVYIDIFAIDRVSDDLNLLKRHYKKLKKCQKLIYMYAYDYKKESKLLRKITKYLMSLFVRYKSLDKLVANYNEVCMEYKSSSNMFAISNWPLYSMKREIQLYNNFKKTIYWNFENIKVKIPKKYDEILKIHFGDYMTLPRESERINHQNEAYWKDIKSDGKNQ